MLADALRQTTRIAVRVKRRQCANTPIVCPYCSILWRAVLVPRVPLAQSAMQRCI
jgi:hypothetical protein